MSSTSGGGGGGAVGVGALAHSAVIAKFCADLKSSGHRSRAAREIYAYVNTELREVPPDELTSFLESLTKRVLDLVKSADAAAKLGGVLAIIALINADVCNTNEGISKSVGYGCAFQ